MKIQFYKISDFREECINLSIHRIRRDYVAAGAAVESGSRDMGKINVTRFKLILTATNGEDLLMLEHPFYRCFSALGDSEETKKEVQKRVEAIETQLYADFPKEYTGPDVPADVGTWSFWLEKGTIEEV